MQSKSKQSKPVVTSFDLDLGSESGSETVPGASQEGSTAVDPCRLSPNSSFELDLGSESGSETVLAYAWSHPLQPRVLGMCPQELRSGCDRAPWDCDRMAIDSGIQRPPGCGSRMSWDSPGAPYLS